MSDAAIDHFALPLFSLVDARKVDLGSRQLPELAEQLGAFLESQHGVRALDWRIEVLGGGPYLVANGVASDALPALFALADIQKCQLYRYRRTSEEEAELKAVAIDPSGRS